jgi:hypothetical protein
MNDDKALKLNEIFFVSEQTIISKCKFYEIGLQKYQP